MQTNIGITSTNIKDLLREMSKDSYKMDRFVICVTELHDNLEKKDKIQGANYDGKYILGSKITVNLETELQDLFNDYLLSSVKDYFVSRGKVKVEDIVDSDLLGLMFASNVGYKKFTTAMRLLFESQDIKSESKGHLVVKDNDEIDNMDDNLEDTESKEIHSVLVAGIDNDINELDHIEEELGLAINTLIDEMKIDTDILTFGTLSDEPDFELLEKQAKEFLSNIKSIENLFKENTLNYQKHYEMLLEKIQKKDNVNMQLNDSLKAINENYKSVVIISKEKRKENEIQMKQLNLDIDNKTQEIEKLNKNQIELKLEYQDIVTKTDEEREIHFKEKDEFIETIENNEIRIKVLEDEVDASKNKIKDMEQDIINITKIHNEEVKSLNINLEKKDNDLRVLYDEIESLNRAIEDYKKTIKEFGTLRKLIEKLSGKN